MGSVMLFHEAESLSELIARQISEQIIHGELLEGEHIPELRIARELDVSRGSVREALLLLERTHLIHIYPRRGAIVSEMSAQQLQALFDSVGMVLTYLVQCISTHRNSDETTYLQQLQLTLQQQVQQGHSEAFYDAIFQSLLQQPSMIHNLYLMQFYQQLLPSLRRSYCLVLHVSSHELQMSFDLFKWATDAILSQNSPQATLFMQDFCRHLQQLVLDSLTRMKKIELAWAPCARR